MLGIVPVINKTFVIQGFINETNSPLEGGIYINFDNRLFMYSKKHTRSNPNNGYFPIWNGSNFIISNSSNKKYFGVDNIDSDDIGKLLDEDQVEELKKRYQTVMDDDVLTPQPNERDNAFTECIKGIINHKEFTLSQLIKRASSKIDERTINLYYSNLNKITFMRIDRWYIWLDLILQMQFNINVIKNNQIILTYKYPSEEIILNGKECNLYSDKDALRRIILILISEFNIDKTSLKKDDIDEYTINNLFSTINGKQIISSQLFQRFIELINLNFEIIILENNQQVFSLYK